ncbi:MAG TPA: tRNA guanosine(34) transglycosylase Tgt [Candidatus Nanoarchaeia archaeon]|nr:tRNA guanosine(34) transglycosylase Tgt [Candidatus Nanoarchaeia archaeon]
MFSFKIKKQSGKARLGIVTTSHGSFETPAFTPVATTATIRGLDNRDIEALKPGIILANAYHLHLRPGDKIIKKLGGLHKFMNWDKTIITDSGGFQAFSLGFAVEHGVGKIAENYLDFSNKNHIKKLKEKKFAQVDDTGVTFKDPINGDIRRLTPKISMEIQSNLGSDIIFAFDECTSPLSSKSYTAEALDRTHTWAEECLKHYNKKQALFGIVQGGEYQDLRIKSAKFIGDLPFRGFGIGGSLGKSKKDMHNILGWTIPLLPDSKPRHLLGIGAVEDIFEAVERGIDMFDCVAPTRWARRGHLYVSPEAGGSIHNKFRLNIENKKYEADKSPIDKTCSCYACRNHTRAYLRHLFRASELTYFRLASLHNLTFILNLMESIRTSIKENKFKKLKNKWLVS